VTDEVRKLLEKGERALHAAETLLGEGDAEFATGRAYYALLYTAQALLRQRGIQFRKHSAVHSAFGKHFAKTGLMDPKYHRWLLDAFDQRLRGDYDIDSSIDEKTAATIIQQAKDFLRAAKLIL
jgi:uncharacterized protein (UPF0332 family)